MGGPSVGAFAGAPDALIDMNEPTARSPLRFSRPDHRQLRFGARAVAGAPRRRWPGRHRILAARAGASIPVRHRADDRSKSTLARSRACAAHRAGRLFLRRRPRRLARRDPHDEARQRDLVRQHVEPDLRALGTVDRAAPAVGDASRRTDSRGDRRGPVDGQQRGIVRPQRHRRPARAARGRALHRLSHRGAKGARRDPAAAAPVHCERCRAH